MKPVNSNQFKKQKVRAAKKALAKENSIKFGRSKSERNAEAKQRSRDEAHLSGHKTQDD